MHPVQGAGDPDHVAEGSVGCPGSTQAGGVVKRWFNRRWPYYRLCLHRWCLRVQTYDHRCYRHQERNEKEEWHG